MTTLGVLVRRLGPIVLSAAGPLTDHEQAREVTGVVLYDDTSIAEIGERDVVLGVGLSGSEDVVRALREVAVRKPAAFIVRAEPAQDAAVAQQARSCTVLLAFAAPASWMQLTLLLRELIDAEAPGGNRADLPTDDLFRVANAIAALLDAPVTIEDPHSRILASSDGQERADEARLATILGRKAPEEFTSGTKQHGMLRKLHAWEKAVFVPGRPPAIKPRFVQPVRAGGEFLGSIWLVVDAPPDEEKQRALSAAARAVALHLIRQRLIADWWRRAEVMGMVSLLSGGSEAEDAAHRLGLAAPAYQVVAIAARHGPSLDSEAMLLRLMDGLRISLSARYESAFAVKLKDSILAVIPLPNGTSTGRADAGVHHFVTRFLYNHAPEQRAELIVGLGNVVTSLTEISRSKEQATQVLAVLRNHADRPPVADIVEVGAPALLQHVIDSLDGDPDLGAADLRRLQGHDAAKNTQFVPTVSAWLDSFGDTDLAAARLKVHPNTVRYRIRQLRDMQLVDLDDPVTRLAMLIHLHRAHLHRARHASALSG